MTRKKVTDDDLEKVSGGAGHIQPINPGSKPPSPRSSAECSSDMDDCEAGEFDIEQW